MLVVNVLILVCCSFGLALFEAVDQSNDAIQITGKESSILVSELILIFGPSYYQGWRTGMGTCT